MNKDFIKEGLELIKKADAAYVTTIDLNGFPSTRAMFNLKNSQQFPKLVDFMAKYEDGLTLFFTTNTSSSKIKHLLNNDKVSVYFCDPKTWQGIMFQGKMEIVKDKGIKDAIWHDEWAMYYAGGGKNSEDYAILRLKPNNAKRYFNLQQFEMKL